MFWAEEIAGEAKERSKGGDIVIRDEKTVSGRVHVGSMRGAAIHGAIHETLDAEGVPNTFLWEHNDFDPMDDIPVYLDRAKFEQYLGMPLKNIPSPVEGFASYADYFAKEFQAVIENAGFHPQFYWGSEWYESGKMDDAIRKTLDSAAIIRKIYKEVSGSERKDTWLPLNVICPQCGKVTTTDATEWDGETVQVNCYPTKVEYTKGCGFSGRVSPFGGKAKLPWKVEWPAKWMIHGVIIEGAGKDHSTRGGSRDVALHIAKEVFNYEAPVDVPYEFLLVGGKKMSSSKGRGSSAAEIAALIPAKIFRLALLGKDIGQQFNFDPEGDTIPVLYDLYDKLFEGYKTTKDDDYAKLFELIHPERNLPTFNGDLPRFSQVAFVVQMPHMNLAKEFPNADKTELHERAEYAKKWLAECAPEKFVFKLQESLPTNTLSDAEKSNIASFAQFLKSNPNASAEDIHATLHELKSFKEIYKIFLGKESGPKAGWFLASLDKNFVLKRLDEAAK